MFINSFSHNFNSIKMAVKIENEFAEEEKNGVSKNEPTIKEKILGMNCSK